MNYSKGPSKAELKLAAQIKAQRDKRQSTVDHQIAKVAGFPNSQARIKEWLAKSPQEKTELMNTIMDEPDDNA